MVKRMFNDESKRESVHLVASCGITTAQSASDLDVQNNAI